MNFDEFLTFVSQYDYVLGVLRGNTIMATIRRMVEKAVLDERYLDGNTLATITEPIACAEKLQENKVPVEGRTLVTMLYEHNLCCSIFSNPLYA